MKRDQPTLVTWPTFPLEAQQRLSRICIWMQKGFFTLKGGFQGLLLCSLINGREWIWYGTYLDCSSRTHTHAAAHRKGHQQ